ncbi:MAG: hypothetical protein H6574_20750 [Lewinellaceae bacterium]|nr:hypothetical protein [Lewinellaceae bacterium]
MAKKNLYDSFIEKIISDNTINELIIDEEYNTNNKFWQKLRTILESRPSLHLKFISYVPGRWADLSFLKEIRSIQKLSIIDKKLNKIDQLDCCSHIEYLGLYGHELKLTGLGNLKHLKELYIDGNADIQFYCKALNLHVLEISNNSIQDFTFLSENHLLSKLSIRHCKNFHDLEPLSKFDNLKDLEITGLNKIFNANYLGEVNSLKSLILIDVFPVNNLNWLERNKNLEIFVLGSERKRYSVTFHDLMILANLPCIKRIELKIQNNIDFDQFKNLLHESKREIVLISH